MAEEHNPHARAAANASATARAVGSYGPRRQYSEQEKADLLRGCVELKKELWSDLDNGTTVRYITSNRQGDDDAGFRRGGTVMDYIIQRQEDGGFHHYLKLGANSGARSTWLVNVNDIERLWSKIPKWVRRQEERLQAALAQVEENRRVLQRRVKTLEKRIERLERHAA